MYAHTQYRYYNSTRYESYIDNKTQVILAIGVRSKERKVLEISAICKVALLHHYYIKLHNTMGWIPIIIRAMTTLLVKMLFVKALFFSRLQLCPQSNCNALTLSRSTVSLLSLNEDIIGEYNITSQQDHSFMKLALRHAQHAFRENEVPIGAAIVDENGIVLAASRNKVEAAFDVTTHAEMDCIRKASALRKNWRLTGCTLYTTLEPCAMCMGAIQLSRIKRVVYGAKDFRLGACGSLVNLDDIEHPFHRVVVSGSLLEEESANLLKSFFRNRRIENLTAKSNDLSRGDIR